MKIWLKNNELTITENERWPGIVFASQKCQGRYLFIEGVFSKAKSSSDSIVTIKEMSNTRRKAYGASGS